MFECSQEDREFLERFETGGVTPAEFDHRAHVRLAYIHLADHDVEGAYGRMRGGLEAFLRRNGVDPSKYHDTLTRAWIMAVRHLMDRTGSASSAGDFIDSNPKLLDSKIMLTHYSAERLFSGEARAAFVDPDLDPIPEPKRPAR